MRFCRDNFESPAHVAVVFGVDPGTAANWWAGTNAPQGWVVARTLTDPALAPRAASALGGE